MARTASYTRAAVDKYNSKFDRITINLPLGSKDKIVTATGKSAAAWCREILENELNKIDIESQPVELQELKPEKVHI